jgi:hypothetical protein
MGYQNKNHNFRACRLYDDTVFNLLVLPDWEDITEELGFILSLFDSLCEFFCRSNGMYVLMGWKNSRYHTE